MFEDYKSHPKQSVNPAILWEYDINSPRWNWEDMKVRVVQRVLQYGDKNDYYAILQMYGGFEGVAEIVKQVPTLSPKDLNWACFLFHVKEEETLCFQKKSYTNWKWVSIKDELPLSGIKVLTLDEDSNGNLNMAIRSYDENNKDSEKWRNEYGGLDFPYTNVVYWMPIPPFPKHKSEKNSDNDHS